MNELTRGEEFAVFPPGDGGRGISADATFDDGVLVDDAVLFGRSVVERNILCWTRKGKRGEKGRDN